MLWGQYFLPSPAEFLKAEVQFAEDKEPDVLSKNTGDENVLN